MHGRRHLLSLLAVAASLTLPSAALAAEGDPDPAFSSDGQAFAGLSDIVGASGVRAAPAPDGTVVVAVATNVVNGGKNRGDPIDGIDVYRADADGDPVARLEIFDGDAVTLLALRVLADGRIVLVWIDNSDEAIYMGRLLANGDPDTTLGPGGRSELLSKFCSGPHAAAIDPDGGAYVLDRCAVHAFGPDGGIVDWGALLEPGGFEDDLRGDVQSELAVAPDGKIVAYVEVHEEDVRGFTGEGAVVRLETDGDHDPTFDSDGVALVDGQPYDLAVDPTGRPVLAVEQLAFRGGSNDEADYLLARLDTDGSIDEDFSQDGIVPVLGPPGYVESAELGTQSDSKVLLLSHHDDFDRGADSNRVVLARYLENGDLDTAFAVGGYQVFQDEDGFPSGPMGAPVQQADGKIIVPLTWHTFAPRSILVGAPPGLSVALFRLLGPTAPQEEDDEPAPLVQPAQTSTPVITSASVSLPVQPIVARRCTSRRSLRIRLRTGRRRSERSPIVSAVITVNGRRVRAVRNGASVNLRNLPKGRYTVRIRLRLKDGGIVNDVRRYRTCTPKIESELAPLRTRKPRKRG